MYAVVSFGLLLLCGGSMGPLAFSPLTIPLAAAVAILTVAGLRLSGVGFTGWVVFLFVGWVAAVSCVQMLINAAASAAV